MTEDDFPEPANLKMIPVPLQTGHSSPKTSLRACPCFPLNIIQIEGPT